MNNNNSHSVAVGYVAWIFGFMGAHRFYYGKPITGTLWFFTFGFFLIGWIVDLFLIPAMDSDADRAYIEGSVNYSICWLLLFLLGVFGAHRMYMGKWLTAVLYLLTFGLFGLGILYDLWTLNDQIDEENSVTHAWV
ncbi:NINE protein [Teredinibacter haidensis]|uniref:NINE protein n=1 Tax=Teredinibacter haidensis TaxID=2731755 RepID=UPI000948F01B|nr:TM2 domain-containing protein [Teredinibacter haidensis]